MGFVSSLSLEEPFCVSTVDPLDVISSLHITLAELRLLAVLSGNDTSYTTCPFLHRFAKKANKTGAKMICTVARMISDHKKVNRCQDETVLVKSFCKAHGFNKRETEKIIQETKKYTPDAASSLESAGFIPIIWRNRAFHFQGLSRIVSGQFHFDPLPDFQCYFQEKGKENAISITLLALNMLRPIYVLGSCTMKV